MSSSHDLNLDPSPMLNDVVEQNGIVQAGSIKPAFFMLGSKPNTYSRVRVWTEDQLKLIQERPELASKMGRKPKKNDPALSLDRDAVLAFGSTQPKKFTEIHDAFSASLPDIKVIEATEFLHWFLSADETSGTYEGNAYEKIEKLIKRIYDDLGYEAVSARLKERGYDPSRVVLGVNDCGFSFNKDYSNEPEFQRSLHERGVTGEWPDVELGPVRDAQGGSRQFDEDATAMFVRKRAAGENIDRTGKDKALYMMFKLTPYRENIKIISSYTEIPVEFVLEYRPNDGIVNYERRLVPLNHDLPDQMSGKTMQEIGKVFWQKYSAQAIALNNFAKLSGVRKSIKNEYDENVKRGVLEPLIATLYNVIEGISNPVDPFDSKFFRKSLPLFHSHKEVDALNRYQRINRLSSGFVLGALGKQILKNPKEYFLELADLWCSLVVDKQLGIETSIGKLFEVIDDGSPFKTSSPEKLEEELIQHFKENDASKNPWRPFILFTRYLHEIGFVKQELEYLFGQHNPKEKKLGEKLFKKIKDMASQQSPYVPDYEREQFGKDRTDLYEVVVLGSASSRVDEYVKEGEELGYWLISMGFHVRTGGGRYGIMGAVSRGAKKFMEEHPHLADQAHLSAIQMPRTLQFEGVDITQDEAREFPNRMLCVEPSFDHRIESLLRSDSCIAMAPGIGTYQEIIRKLKQTRNNSVHNKILMFNRTKVGTVTTGLMDIFIKGLLPKRFHSEMKQVFDIDAVKTQIIAEYRVKHGKDPVPLLQERAAVSSAKGFHLRLA